MVASARILGVSPDRQMAGRQWSITLLGNEPPKVDTGKEQDGIVSRLGATPPHTTTSPIISRTLPAASDTSNGKHAISSSSSPANRNLTVS